MSRNIDLNAEQIKARIAAIKNFTPGKPEAPLVDNGLVLTKQNIEFRKNASKKAVEARIAKIKDFDPTAPVAFAITAAPKVKHKKSHAERRAAIVARSIANDPKQNSKAMAKSSGVMGRQGAMKMAKSKKK